MAAIAGHPAAFHLAATDTTSEMTGLRTFNWGPSGNLIDITDTADTSGMHIKLLGLKDCQISLSGFYDSSDTAQNLLRTSWGTGATCYCRVLPDGSTGVKGVFKVQDYKINIDVDKEVTFEATLMGTGALGTV
jgi:predicted secreted protein